MHERIAPEAQMVFCRRRPAEKSTARQYQDRAWKPSTCDGNGNGGVLSSSLILKAPRPTGVRRRAGTCHLHCSAGADDQLIAASLEPRHARAFFVSLCSEPAASHFVTNQARRGSRFMPQGKQEPFF
jgi:hypothetical protein